MFFPIPPNRECIERVDLALHTPLAVDYFYNYLQSRHEQLKDKQAIHLIALYIDLRLYDKACSDEEEAEIKQAIAEQIYAQYLSAEALATKENAGEDYMSADTSYFPVTLDPAVQQLF